MSTDWMEIGQKLDFSEQILFMSLVTRRLIIPLINKGDIKRRKLGKENCELSFRICKKIFFIIFYSEII